MNISEQHWRNSCTKDETCDLVCCAYCDEREYTQEAKDLIHKGMLKTLNGGQS